MAVPASPLLTTPSSKPAAASMIPSINKTPNSAAAASSLSAGSLRQSRRREVSISMTTAGFLAAACSMFPILPPASAASDEEYVRETEEVISKVRQTMSKDKTDPNVASAVDELRDASNSWVAKYRREKSLLGRPSFRDMYSALNAVSGHYISFGPTAPIPAKRKARILEEVETAEKALLRGR